MSENRITKDEQADKDLNVLDILLRYVNSLTLVKIVFVPTLLLLLCATAVPQLLIWLVGEAIQCPDMGNCLAQLHNPFAMQLQLSYKFLICLYFVALLMRILAWVLFDGAGQWSCLKLCQNMIAGLSRVRTTFYDENPSGRIITRFASDFEDLRAIATNRMGDVVSAVIEIISIGLIIAISQIWSALALIPALLAYLYMLIQTIPMKILASQRNSIRRGQTLHRETDFIEGGRIFALYGQYHALSSKLANAVREWSDMAVINVQLELWGNFWMMCIASAYLLVAMFGISLSLNLELISTTVAAVMISILFRLNPNFQNLYYLSSNLANSAAHAHRVFALCDLPDEVIEERKQGPAIITRTKDLLTGDIQFIKFSASYRKDLPLVLKGLDLLLPYQKKIGVVGRTGSGKSSIIQSLYRMLFVHAGDIQIAGRSIYELDLQHLRNHFAMVPQDPYLFSGTLKSNLDFYNQYDSTSLLAVRDAVGLDLDLETPIVEGGVNISLGQRQLVCMARVMLSPAPYIILDEPTSGIDMLTDAAIQGLLLSQFDKRTVITIAHREETLSACDLIVKISEGQAEV